MDDLAMKYWANEVRYELENNDQLSGISKDKYDLDDICVSVAEDLVYNDEYLWEIINERIVAYVLCKVYTKED